MLRECVLEPVREALGVLLPLRLAALVFVVVTEGV
jgi:hypothetical protein